MKTQISNARLRNLIEHLSHFEGWSIKNWDNFTVLWQEEDGFPNWCDNGRPEGFTYRCGKKTVYATVILAILGWDVEDCLDCHKE